MTTDDPRHSELPARGNAADKETPTLDHATAHRAAMRQATARVLNQIAQGAEHELVVAVSSQDALEELVPLLDRLLAVGNAARRQDTEEGWREAHRRLLNASVLIRVAELRHAAGVKMDYVPSKAGDKEDVETFLAALARLSERLRIAAT